MIPLVDVIIPVYNHEKYIAQSIEGILAQKTNFKYRLVIGEDKSTDNTRAIIEKYAGLHPDIIYPIYHKKNLGAVENGVFLISQIKAKYVAICEGDDYWIDPTKLQRQFDFMEANPEFSMCFTRAGVIDNEGKEVNGMFPEINKEDFSIEDIIMAGAVFIPTATIFFRNILPDPLPELYFNSVSADIVIHLLVCDKGKIKCLPGITAIYRDHPGGFTKSEKVVKEGFTKLFELFIEANEYFSYRYDATIRQRLLQMSRVKLIHGSRDMKGIKKVKHYFASMPDYLKYSDKINFKELIYYHVVLFFPFLLKHRKSG